MLFAASKEIARRLSFNPVTEDVADPSYLVSIHEFQTFKAIVVTTHASCCNINCVCILTFKYICFLRFSQ